jgi:predicted O-methyltransferase YrrM
MNITDPAMQKYAEAHTTSESNLLSRLNRDTHANVLLPRMLSGHLQGRLLAMISKMVQPKRVLEIGTYTGYSAICLSEGLTPDGKLITIDVNNELEHRVRQVFEEGGVADRIDFRIGNALSIIPQLDEVFDLVFIDADKVNYCRYFDLVIDKLRPGGIILADNVLWSGKVLAERPDKDTRGILEFNTRIHDDLRVENVLLPLRDGIFVIRKISL